MVEDYIYYLDNDKSCIWQHSDFVIDAAKSNEESKKAGKLFVLASSKPLFRELTFVKNIDWRVQDMARSIQSKWVEESSVMTRAIMASEIVAIWAILKKVATGFSCPHWV